MRNKVPELIEKLQNLNMKTVRISKKNAGTFFANLITYAVLISLSVIFLVPFIYLITRSVMSAKDLADINVQWIPRSFIIENYTFALKLLDYLPRLMWSLLIVGLSVFGQVISSAFVAYGLARIKFKGNGLIFGLILFCMVIPPQALIVTQYLVVARMKMIDTPLPIVLPCFFAQGLNGGLFIFLFRQFFKGMPRELENAALIDGTGIFGAFFRIILPNSGATILVTSILSFIWQWNNYFEPSIYITSKSKYTLSMMLSDLSSTALQFNMEGFNSGVNLAATLLCALPIIVVFFLLQKRFIKGTETSGLAN